MSDPHEVGGWVGRVPLLAKFWAIPRRQQSALDALERLREEILQTRAELRATQELLRGEVLRKIADLRTGADALDERLERASIDTRQELRHLRACYAEFYGALHRHVRDLADAVNRLRHEGAEAA